MGVQAVNRLGKNLPDFFANASEILDLNKVGGYAQVARFISQAARSGDTNVGHVVTAVKPAVVRHA